MMMIMLTMLRVVMMLLMMLNMRLFKRLNHADTRVGGGEGRVKNLNNGSDTLGASHTAHANNGSNTVQCTLIMVPIQQQSAMQLLIMVPIQCNAGRTLLMVLMQRLI